MIAARPDRQSLTNHVKNLYYRVVGELKDACLARQTKSKLTVYDYKEDSHTPFLRGILTRSLQVAGMSFEEAYKIASRIRDDISELTEISTEEISQRVSALLGKNKATDTLKRYEACPHPPVYIQVRDRQNQVVPFSKSYLSRSLEICAFSREKCFEIASSIEQQLRTAEKTWVSSLELARFTYEYLLEHASKEMARRYLVWMEFADSGKPLVLLVGGATGCGKSTISSELAHRLDIVRTQSTDMLREVMRLMIPPRLLPVLHTSTFNAWEALPTQEENAPSFETHLIEGYLTQSEHVGVGIDGVMKRAERERVSLILEGVHIYPGLQKRLASEFSGIVVPFVLAVMKRNQLKERLQGRGQRITSRRSERYLGNFNSIWQLQSFLLDEADRKQIPIIPNDDEDVAIKSIMEAVVAVLEKEFSGDPEKVFQMV